MKKILLLALSFLALQTTASVQASLYQHATAFKDGLFAKENNNDRNSIAGTLGNVVGGFSSGIAYIPREFIPGLFGTTSEITMLDAKKPRAFRVSAWTGFLNSVFLLMFLEGKILGYVAPNKTRPIPGIGEFAKECILPSMLLASWVYALDRMTADEVPHTKDVIQHSIES